MRYLVAEGAVGPNGRQVKCAHCGHKWFQDGEEGLDEALFDVEDEAPAVQAKPSAPERLPEGAIAFEDHPLQEDDAGDFQSILQKEMAGDAKSAKRGRDIPEIPEGVRPEQGGQGDLVMPSKRGLKLPGMDARLGGFATAALIFVLIFGVLLLMQPQVSRLWPPSNMIYSAIGLTPVAPGEGLSLANLQAKFEDNQVTLSGDINNLKPNALDVPAVLASFIGADDAVLGQVLIPPPIDRIKGEGNVSFSAVHADVPAAATNVTFAFSYMKAEKRDEAEADSHEDEGDHVKEEAHEENHAAPENH